MNPKSSSISREPSNPHQLGYRMPAEWEGHEATWMVWPQLVKQWPQHHLDAICQFYCRFIAELGQDEQVVLSVIDGDMERSVLGRLDANNLRVPIQLRRLAATSAFCRAYGPTVLTYSDRSGSFPSRVAVDWGSIDTGAGEQASIANHVAQALGIPSVAGSIGLRGDMIDSNGCGDLLVAGPADKWNGQDHWGSRISKLLGCNNLIWVEHANQQRVAIDRLARFAGETQIVVASNEIKRQLQGTSLNCGSKAEVIVLPEVQHQPNHDGLAYTGYYVANKTLFVPQFEDSADRVAVGMLADLFPGRRIVGMPCQAIQSFHRITIPIPRA